MRASGGPRAARRGLAIAAGKRARAGLEKQRPSRPLGAPSGCHLAAGAQSPESSVKALGTSTRPEQGLPSTSQGLSQVPKWKALPCCREPICPTKRQRPLWGQDFRWPPGALCRGGGGRGGWGQLGCSCGHSRGQSRVTGRPSAWYHGLGFVPREQEPPKLTSPAAGTYVHSTSGQVSAMFPSALPSAGTRPGPEGLSS